MNFSAASVPTFLSSTFGILSEYKKPRAFEARGFGSIKIKRTRKRKEGNGAPYLLGGDRILTGVPRR
jgi:hypothetical protein